MKRAHGLANARLGGAKPNRQDDDVGDEGHDADGEKNNDKAGGEQASEDAARQGQGKQGPDDANDTEEKLLKRVFFHSPGAFAEGEEGEARAGPKARLF